jgi:hypothetical protein
MASARTGIKSKPLSICQKANKMNGVPNNPHIKIFEAERSPMRKPADVILTYLLTPWSRVLLKKLTGFADSQEIPHIYGTRKFITVLTSARHLSLS